ncbi:Cysteinyl-tRNA synthetase [Alteracholeplasma palmae J233]|uniref:Cysteine--tRNA ligase n=1 Tax=Alteracholeplasma palmae (strain ATCC 49389 / J233) TaxID=1318466 RepID=U4KQN0_ALTPJ|nr:cysteine--tRNA ligase [Alteracholeplasma palmae]CCV64865.1 Cysteinyl-tRNA synthetase [Alteracholeplasma palmae J233]
MLKIYNSLSNKIEEFKSIKPNSVDMYVCGPTVYDHIHIGNARPLIFFNMLKQYLISMGYKVNYVTNITDVDDKIIDKAIKLNQTEKEVATTYTNAFINVINALNVNSIDMMPKATDYIASMIKYIEELIQLGFAYQLESGVYFRVKKVKNYGRLSNQNIDTLIQNIRKELDSKKENPEDFALWKTTDKGIKYDSPWVSGRPGWHTECAVMNHDIFEGKIDIHGGGFDLKFPHHENEIAQTCAHDNTDLANYFMHVGRLDLENVKMSKSLGNVFLVKDLIEQEKTEAFKLLILAHHYRQPINFSHELLEQFSKNYERIQRTLKKASFNLELNGIILNETDAESLESFHNLMNDDFSTPNVLTLIEELIKKINVEKDRNLVSKYKNTVIHILNIFGIKIDTFISDDMIDIYKKWQQARKDKDYGLADTLREKLTEQGLI